ncbi:hypothetical protein HHK36_023871 [Tetracentron sinense]|uniref:Retrovirus-related Pol polyprotein from transposon TNT 1-94-like beta-barrel domain-containing protein n=1 Tax=Tetracentron sinense TaxID=13715 RepID=A0A834YNX5_TETSI|nr:hypothetical protein HHK36_023871 [Tetracentron sinense]
MNMHSMFNEGEDMAGTIIVVVVGITNPIIAIRIITILVLVNNRVNISLLQILEATMTIVEDKTTIDPINHMMAEIKLPQTMIRGLLFPAHNLLQMTVRFVVVVVTQPWNVAIVLTIHIKHQWLRHLLLSLFKILKMLSGTPIVEQFAHMTNNEGNLSRITSYHGADRVLVGNGSCIPISHTGSVSLNTPTGFFQLNNTLLVPHIKKNLISVCQFTRDNDCQFTFSSSGFVIQARKTGKVLGTGSSKAGLYVLDRLHQAFLSSSSVKGSSEIWHNRLGHVAPTTIDVPSSSPPNPAFHQPDPPSIDIVPLNSQVPSTTPAIDPSESISSASSSLDQLPPSSPSTGSIDLPAPTTSTCSNINDHPDELGASIMQPIPTTRACDIPGVQIIIQLPLAPPNAHPMLIKSLLTCPTIFFQVVLEQVTSSPWNNMLFMLYYGFVVESKSISRHNAFLAYSGVGKSPIHAAAIPRHLPQRCCMLLGNISESASKIYGLNKVRGEYAMKKST